MNEDSATPHVEQSVLIARYVPAALKFAVQAVVIGVPVLYTLGRVYAEGYWKTIALSGDLMTYSVEDYLYLGFIAILNAATRLFAWMPMGPIGTTLMVVVACAFVAVLVVVVRRWLVPILSERLRLAARRIRAWKANEDSWVVQFLRPFVALGLGAYTLLFYFFVAFLCVTLPLVGVYKAGDQAAQRARKVLEGVGPVTFLDARAIIHLKGQSPKQAGVLLECSTDWCVMLRRGDFVAVRQADVSRIDHCPKTIALKNGEFICDAGSAVVP